MQTCKLTTTKCTMSSNCTTLDTFTIIVTLINDYTLCVIVFSVNVCD